MSSWLSLQFNFAPFAPLLPPLQSALVVLETVEAILEALFDIIKVFLLGLLSPLLAIVALLLAAIRVIINQFEASGFSILLVHPDFSRGDFGAVLNSCSGGYTAFETKVVSKFFDLSDSFRPQYPDGSAVAMFVFYIGAETPGDLLGLLMSLLNLIHHTEPITVPAPVNVVVAPVMQGSNGIAQAVNTFEGLFNTKDASGVPIKKLPYMSVSWQMPTSPPAATGSTFVSSLVSFYNAFRFPNFVVERSSNSVGDEVLITLKSQTFGNAQNSLYSKYNFPKPSDQVELKENNGNVFRNFPTKFPISSQSGLLEGELTNTYQYIDKDKALIPGNNYWYRVRAYFGNPSAYLNAKSTADILQSTDLIRSSGNSRIINYGQGVAMGLPSVVVRGHCPPAASDFDVYQNTYDAIRVGLLLNFEFPLASSSDSATVIAQKTGWSSLNTLAGQVAPLKTAYSDSKSLQNSTFFNWAARKIANEIASSSYPKPDLLKMLATKWNKGVGDTVNSVINAKFVWGFVGINGGVTPGAVQKINTYLELESSYGSNPPPFAGPYPLNPIMVGGTDISISASSRQDLSDFINLAIGSSSAGAGYLRWYSVTLGDLFPSLIPFINDFQQFLLNMLKALMSLIAEIAAIMETILTKIRQLEAVLEAIIQIIELLQITVTVAILGVSSDNGSAADLALALTTSDNKPGSSPFGLHSGMVITFGGPGKGFVAAFKALGFVLGIS